MVKLLACSFMLSSPGLVCNRQCSLVSATSGSTGCLQKGWSCPHRCGAGVSLALALIFTWSSGRLGLGVKWAAKAAFCWVRSTVGWGDKGDGVGMSSWEAVVAIC